jgi:CubicO group peptidase (beta-lactamase class C family)
MIETSAGLSRTLALLQGGIAEGLHPGAQLFVWHRGSVVADLAVGEARLGVPMRPDSLTLWLSSVKPVAAVALGQLFERGALGWDDPVSKFVPEFAEGGKESVTIRHLLTHTGGVRTADKCDHGKEWPEIIECVCHAPLEPNWVPGQMAAYHPSGSWYMLGEIIRRIDGRPFDLYLREEIFAPCGMHDSWIALPVAQFRRYGDRVSLVFHTERGAPSPHRKWNAETEAAICRPGRNGRGPIRELGFFYVNLLRLRRGEDAATLQKPILKTDTVRTLTSRQRTGMFDDTFRHLLDWGMGFSIDSNRYGKETTPYGYGRFCSDETFGHSGSQSSCAFADPVNGLVVAWVCNGIPGENRHQVRARELNSAIYQDLAIAS